MHDDADRRLRDAFARDVAALLAPVGRGLSVSDEPLGRSGRGWSVRPAERASTGADRVPLSVDIELVDVSVGVRLATDTGRPDALAWSFDQTLDPGDSEGSAQALDDAIDLFAAALWGSARWVVTARGDRQVRGAIQFGGGRQWITHATVHAPMSLGMRMTGMTGWWGRAATVTARNEVAAPRGGSSQPVTPNPTAPWSGVFTAARTTAAPQEIPIDGVLDLHLYRPKQVKSLVLEYIQECRSRGIVELRIIHGKGIGNLRRTVHALLDRHEHVQGYRLGGHGGGSWGATLVELRPL